MIRVAAWSHARVGSCLEHVSVSIEKVSHAAELVTAAMVELLSFVHEICPRLFQESVFEPGPFDPLRKSDKN